MRAVRAPVLGALGPASGPSDPSASLHRDRDRHGRGNHGTWDSWEEVAMCLAFARLSHEQVEVISDTSLMASFTGQS